MTELNDSGTQHVNRNGKHVAFFMSSLAGGGVERSMLTLAKGYMAMGHRVDLVLCHRRGDYSVPDGIRLIELDKSSALLARLHILMTDPAGIGVFLKPILLPLKVSNKLKYVSSLAKYLKRERPQALISAMTNPNLVAIWARRIANCDTRIVVSERNTLSSFVEHNNAQWRWRYMPSVVNRVYPRANDIIAVSQYVANDLQRTCNLPEDMVRTIYNPVLTPELKQQALQEPAHEWLMHSTVPVILAAGRLMPAKDFHTLIRAFALLRKNREARLVILGEGAARQCLQILADELNVSADVDMPGWFENPFACMAKASVFVLSSAWEGLPGVLIQAMACGCPVVSTDCPGGSREILEDGTIGPLVPVGDHQAMAQAIVQVLDNPVKREILTKRASVFSEQRSIEQYEEVCFAKT